jgi:hypothetical protein
MNPLYPTGIVIPKGNFNEEHKGTIWFESDKAMDDFFRDLYEKMYPPDPEPKDPTI